MEIYNDSGAIVTKYVRAAQVFNDILTANKCAWRMEWFPFLASRQGQQNIFTQYVNQYCTTNRIYKDDRNMWGRLWPKTRAAVLEVVRPTFEPVAKVFAAVFDNNESQQRDMLEVIRGNYEQLPQFFEVAKNGFITLKPRYREQ